LTGEEICTMTLRIEKSTDGAKTILRLTGRIRQEHLEELSAQISAIKAQIVIDIEEVALVDANSVSFLGDMEARGIEILNCSPYIREWIHRQNEEARS
jgi:anti-anti-sigma regulatory factor